MTVKSILLELYYGNYSAVAQNVQKGSGYARALDRVVELEDGLRASIPGKLEEEFEKYLEANEEMIDEACKMNFIEGCRLGARMMLNVLEDAPNE